MTRYIYGLATPILLYVLVRLYWQMFP